MNLLEILSPSSIKIALESETREEVFEEMLHILTGTGKITDRDRVLEDLYRRERQMSTGIERGIAIPHCKTAGVTELVAALGVSKQGINYESLDGNPIHLVIMMIATLDNPGKHIAALGEIARLMKIHGFYEKIINATSSDEVVECIKKEELG